MGIVESETVSFAQLKGAKTVTGGIRGSKTGTSDDSEKIMVDKGGSVCVDMVTEEEGGMIEGFD